MIKMYGVFPIFIQQFHRGALIKKSKLPSDMSFVTLAQMKRRLRESDKP